MYAYVCMYVYWSNVEAANSIAIVESMHTADVCVCIYGVYMYMYTLVRCWGWQQQPIFLRIYVRMLITYTHMCVDSLRNVAYICEWVCKDSFVVSMYAFPYIPPCLHTFARRLQANSIRAYIYTHTCYTSPGLWIAYIHTHTHTYTHTSPGFVNSIHT